MEYAALCLLSQLSHGGSFSCAGRQSFHFQQECDSSLRGGGHWLPTSESLHFKSGPVASNLALNIPIHAVRLADALDNFWLISE